jgi:acetyl-CoA synthetase
MSQARPAKALEALLEESRAFPPPPEFARLAHVKDRSLHEQAARDPEGFWADQARRLEWAKPWTKVLAWKLPFAQWFLGGRLNVSVNCLDRHVRGGKGAKRALVWEGEPGDERTLTYAELLAQVCRCANALKSLGVKRGDRVTLYMPMVPELAIALLACTRIGAAHSVVFGGFSPDALRERIRDSGSVLVVTADGGWRRGQVVPLKQNVDEALKGVGSVKSVLVVKRVGDRAAAPLTEGRDRWWHDVVSQQPDACEPEAMESEDLLFLLYTSGTTGKPKGIVHTTGGYLVGTAATTRWVFDLKDDDVYWCTADIGWVTGHSYVVYGPLANAATVVMYEGAPDWPAKDRFWDLIARRKVTILYTAPTAIRTFMKWGAQEPEKHDLTSLRLLGSVGEPINPEAWIWYHEHIGGGRCPVVDTWWQTETGAIMISPLPGVTTTKPGSCTRPLPGVVPDIVSKSGESLPANAGGLLVLRQPWPSMLRTLYGDHERFVRTYFSEIAGCYFAGDGARRDEDGYYWVMGRVDDVLNVAGHRLSTMEIESALVSHPQVAEAAVVGFPHDLKGEGICCFVSLTGGEGDDELKQHLKDHVRKQIGALATPDMIRFSNSLPKTRSGKIMRRLLRDIAAGREKIGDTTTLEDYSVLAKLRASEE